MLSFERLQIEAFRYGILVEKDDDCDDRIYFLDLDTNVLLCNEYGIYSIEAAYEFFENLIKDDPEPEMSTDYAERKFPDFLEYIKLRRAE